MNHEEKKGASTGVWVIVLICVAAVIFALCGGAAYSGIQQARLTAAKASIGQIEAVLYLAEERAEQQGLGTSPGSFSSLLKSYDNASVAMLPDYERAVIDDMLGSFGPARDFDFAISRHEDNTGVHTQIYFFPTRGRVDMKTDRYYLLSAGALSENN